VRLITVSEILSSGNHGGAIFFGLCEEAHTHRFVASADVMPRAPVAGETWLIDGVIKLHPKYGRQVELRSAFLQRPSGRLLVSALSKSRSFPGIGTVRAQRLWQEFGEEIYALLEKGDPEPFEDVLDPELGKVLVDGWRTLSVEAAVYAWLDKHAIPPGLATRLISIYGDDAIRKLEENPYRLLAFTSWKEAERLARAMYIEPEDERRLEAATDAAGYRLLHFAHTWAKRENFLDGVRQVLGCNREVAVKALETGFNAGSILEVASGIQGLGPASMERYVASRTNDLLSGNESYQMTFRRAADPELLNSFFAEYPKRFNRTLNTEQQESVGMALSQPLALIMGGAGVGKTTTLHAIVQASRPLNAEVHLMALSGRAARRMEEATNHPARTIASFLSAVDSEEISLDSEPTLAIDEASMVDLSTMYRILRRMRPGCKLLMVGDPGQLPPIGFGLVFHTLCETPSIPRVELTEIHRQAAETGIPQVSRSVRLGQVPELTGYKGRGVGVSFIDCPEGRTISDKVLDVVHDLGGFDEAQIICPIKNSPAGTRVLNGLCHNLIAPGRRSYAGFCTGEPVIWLHNNYELGLMNGSLGRVRSIEDGLTVDWIGEDEKQIANTQDMDLAYAITVHKAQGSQFPRVVVPLFNSRILDRTLVYTAITRAQYQVVMVGDRLAFEQSVTGPPNPSRRQTAMNFYLNLLKEDPK
jgi:exodeoxyribonuclease V alpha subunit